MQRTEELVKFSYIFVDTPNYELNTNFSHSNPHSKSFVIKAYNNSYSKYYLIPDPIMLIYLTLLQRQFYYLLAGIVKQCKLHYSQLQLPTQSPTIYKY